MRLIVTHIFPLFICGMGNTSPRSSSVEAVTPLLLFILTKAVVGKYPSYKGYPIILINCRFINIIGRIVPKQKLCNLIECLSKTRINSL